MSVKALIFLCDITAAGRLVGIHNIPGLDTVPHFRKIGMPRGRFARLWDTCWGCFCKAVVDVNSLYGTRRVLVDIGLITCSCLNLLTTGWHQMGGNNGRVAWRRIWDVTTAALPHEVCLKLRSSHRGRRRTCACGGGGHSFVSVT